MSAAASSLYASSVFQSIAGGAWRPGGTALTRHGLELCALAPGSTVLDVGCGSGASLALVRELGLNGTGLDRECSLTEPFPFVQADAQNPPFPDASFDAILCECVLSLLPGAGQALHRFAEILKPEGRLLLSDLFVRGGEPSARPSPGTSCLAGARTRQETERLLTEHGFSLLHFEDHTASLKELAARLLWYGDESVCGFLRGGRSAEAGAFRDCACGSLRPGGLRYGYGLWIAVPARNTSRGGAQKA